MDSFSLTLASNAIITGLRTPAGQEPPPKDTPLIIALHGGSYSADYYNATPTYSALPYSNFLRVPFIALNRPGYKDSTDLPDPVPDGSTFLQEEGRYLHNEILPAVWKAYAGDYGVSSIVILAHSLSVPMTIVAAALNATTSSLSPGEQASDQEPKPQQDTLNERDSDGKEESANGKTKAYPLAGIILSGFGTTPNAPSVARVSTLVDLNAPRVTYPPSLKDELMLFPPSAGYTDPEIYEKTESLNTSAGKGELADMIGHWPAYWRERYA
ncbi:MAG: hypothetical protein Q9213_001197, partial [Squamulea squamosa]